jgi:hypothetical protein
LAGVATDPGASLTSRARLWSSAAGMMPRPCERFNRFTGPVPGRHLGGDRP